jgi:hypothetical protein
MKLRAWLAFMILMKGRRQALEDRIDNIGKGFKPVRRKRKGDDVDVSSHNGTDLRSSITITMTSAGG